MKPATSLPWVWLQDEGQFIVNQHRDIVGETPCQGNGSKANGAYIVHACNNFPRLVEALRDITSGLSDTEDTMPLIRGREVREIRALLRELGELE